MYRNATQSRGANALKQIKRISWEENLQRIQFLSQADGKEGMSQNQAPAKFPWSVLFDF